MHLVVASRKSLVIVCCSIRFILDNVEFWKDISHEGTQFGRLNDLFNSCQVCWLFICICCELF